MLSSSEIRRQFVEFFCKKHGHANVPSSPVVPLNDPSLLFANAGMNQFKPYFLGTEKPPVPRVANTQKCIRAGGKHNDLDDVGKDTYHHTFFEMLGNWSFGDYFKQEAIAWAWELLTEVWQIDPTRLHVTVFEGDPANGIPRDDEAAGFWKAVGVPPERIHLGNKKDNFWEMGNTGPCGPCTEIHYDNTPDKSGGPLVNGGSDKVVEIWNLVFIQFNRNEDQSLTPLPARHVDTGMGFERITKVIQGKDSNYDTDVFQPIFAAIQQVTGAAPYTGVLDNLKDTAYRVIADHVRTLTFALTDGATIGNVGRDYVLRRILRRAERYGVQVLGTTEPFLHRLVATVVDLMGDAFPELLKNPEKVRGQVFEEEEGFLRNLTRGMRLFASDANRAILDLIAKFQIDHTISLVHYLDSELMRRGVVGGGQIDFKRGNEVIHTLELPNTSEELSAFLKRHCGGELPIISGDDAFKLHDTYGVIIDITEQMAQEQGLTVDIPGFEKAMEVARTKTREGGKKFAVSAINWTLPPTDDSAKFNSGSVSAAVMGWIKDNDPVFVGKLSVGESAALWLDRTNFYAEQGGQVGDTGTIRSSSGAIFEVKDTQRLGETVLHFGTLHDADLAYDDTVELVPAAPRRADVMRNHTATHLLNLALKQVLGGDVEQRGSLVDDAKTRFDFTHDKPVTPEQLREIEERVNRGIIADQPVTADLMPLAAAKQLPGVRAVFGEKYPDPVRVVMIGAETPAQVTHDDSVEFCGGTHMPRTGSIGVFKVVSQEPVAKGVRRITAVTGRAAYAEVQARNAVVDDLTGRFQCKPDELPARVEALQEQVKKLQEQVKKGAAADLAGVVDKLLAAAPSVNGAKLVVGRVPDGTTSEAIRGQIDRIRQTAGSSFVVFGWADEGGKVPLIAALSADLVKKGLKAGDVVKQVAAVVGGSGGGKPDIAQAGGKDAAKLPDALQKAVELGTELLSR